MNTRLNDTIVPLNEIMHEDEPRSGAKAYNCARLRQAGFPVPDGLVVLSTATERDVAMLANHLWFDRLPADVVFAVRSSGIGEDGAGESFAGIHETILNVHRRDLWAAMTKCRASAQSTQALAYRRSQGISTDDMVMGVLIQRMILPSAAGVAFTINPVTGANDELVINSSWGLGEALVSGLVDPDELVVRKQTGELIWSRIGDKGNVGQAGTLSLTAAQIGELAGMLNRIERHYGSPQDVEWCHDGTSFWIVQSRPVTTSRSGTDETEWTRANLAEVLPDLTSHQVLSAFEEMLNRAERQLMGKLVAPEEQLGPIVKAFCGRLHFNLSQLRRICQLGGIAPAAMLRSMGHAGAIQPADEQPPRPTFAQLSCLPDLLRIVWRHVRASHIVRKQQVNTEDALARLTARDPVTLSDAVIWSTIEAWVNDAPDYMQAVLLLGNVMFHETPVRNACEKVGFSFERLVYPQLATGERSVSAQQAYDLVALADIARRDPEVVRFLSGDVVDASQMRVRLHGTAFLAELDRFLASYGHRGRYEYDWSLPRYSEDPTLLLLALRAHLEDGLETRSSQTAVSQEREAARASEEFEQHLTPWQRRTLWPGVRRSIRKIKQYYIWREKVRSDLVRVVGAVRQWHLVLAERFVERGVLSNRDEYFLLDLREVGAIVQGKVTVETVRSIIAARAAERERYRGLRMPLLMRPSELPAMLRMASVSGGSSDERELRGQAVSSGCIEAEVVVVRDPGDFGRMKRGAILVAPATDPSWTPLFTLASGVIVEVGGVLSHASTIAREYGLPALANVKHATTRLRTGERVRLDAAQGLVYRLASTA